MNSSNGNDVVRLTTVSNPAMAHLWQNILKDEGIFCEVVGDYLDAGLGDLPGMQAEIWVRADQLKKAQEILEAHEARHARHG